jgi:hypothetical protein
VEAGQEEDHEEGGAGESVKADEPLRPCFDRCAKRELLAGEMLCGLRMCSTVHQTDDIIPIRFPIDQALPRLTVNEIYRFARENVYFI